MILFIKLFLAHIIGDFVLQPDSWVQDKQNKKYKSTKLYFHIIIHLIVTAVLIFNTKYFLIIILIPIVHLIIDLLKLYAQDRYGKRSVFFADQILHILFLLLIAHHFSPFLNHLNIGLDANNLLLLLLCILIITTVSSRVIKILISKWSPENEDNDEDSLSNAGSYIGILERLFVFGFIISGHLSVIGFLLAAKSIFRFGDLTRIIHENAYYKV